MQDRQNCTRCTVNGEISAEQKQRDLFHTKTRLSQDFREQICRQGSDFRRRAFGVTIYLESRTLLRENSKSEFDSVGWRLQIHEVVPIIATKQLPAVVFVRVMLFCCISVPTTLL